jgi:hypothetical protein
VSQSQSPGSPYATGGGGVQLEHEYAACALASLLLAQPIEGLGDELTVTHVAMQQGAWSPVDDLIVHPNPIPSRTLESVRTSVRCFATATEALVEEPEPSGRPRLPSRPPARLVIGSHSGGT